ncbi:MAG: PAN domain-containing protein [Bacteroidales bacterium]|nr:PAN domain-containing protein [Bacteroidales bacterium]
MLQGKHSPIHIETVKFLGFNDNMGIKSLVWVLFVVVNAVGLFVYAVLAEQAPVPEQNSSKCEGIVPQNVEIRVQRLTNAELPSWTGQIFALADGKPAAAVSSEMPCQQLEVGNYVLMLHFQETLPEIETLRPFTFSISANHKTIFTLQIGKSEEPEMEYDVVRTGADFIETDPRRGRDYVNFELPKDQPELCMDRCKKDPNCDAYSYGSSPGAPAARCWLIHGAAVPRPAPHGVSGVITRDASPSYQVIITTEQAE